MAKTDRKSVAEQFADLDKLVEEGLMTKGEAFDRKADSLYIAGRLEDQAKFLRGESVTP